MNKIYKRALSSLLSMALISVSISSFASNAALESINNTSAKTYSTLTDLSCFEGFNLRRYWASFYVNGASVNVSLGNNAVYVSVQSNSVYSDIQIIIIDSAGGIVSTNGNSLYYAPSTNVTHYNITVTVNGQTGNMAVWT